MTTPRDPGETPGESEFSWGPGMMPNPQKEPPHPYHDKKAASRTNRHSDDPDYQESFEGEFE
jgi:hypothetical protein